MDRRGIQPDDPLTAELPFVGVENVVGGTGIARRLGGSPQAYSRKGLSALDEPARRDKVGMKACRRSVRTTPKEV